MLGIVPDDYEATRSLIEQGLEYDVLLTSGGVSVGEFDFVKDVQDELGVERRLWGVAMKPGKPLAFGVRGRTLVFGLPGNPVSAMVSFELFVKPALLRLMGYPQDHAALYPAIIEEDVANPDGRTYVVRVRAWREGRHLARQLHRRPGVGDAPVHGGGQRTGLRSRRTAGREGRRRGGVPAPARGSGRTLIAA